MDKAEFQQYLFKKCPCNFILPEQKYLIFKKLYFSVIKMKWMFIF